MNEFIEKLIGRLEELKELHKELIKDGLSVEYHSGCKALSEDVIEIVNQLAEEYNNQNTDQDLMIVESLPSLYPMMQPFEVEAMHRVVERWKYGDGWIEKLLEAKKNCGEDSDCSKCPFGQIEDRCILNELQIESDNNGWNPCSERLPEEQKCKDGHIDPSEEVLVYIYYGKNCVSNGCAVSRYWNASRHYDNPWIDLKCGKENVVAWQPLPEAFKPEGE